MAGKATLVESETYVGTTWFCPFSLSVFCVKWCWFISQNIIIISIYNILKRQVHVTMHHYRRRRKNQQMTQVYMFIHNRLTQHVLGIIMPIFRRTDCIKPRVVLACNTGRM